MLPEVVFDDDDPSSRLEWLRTHVADLAVVPLPGGGATAARFSMLSALGRADGSLGRLGEGHLDALAIRSELGAPPGDPDQLWGVWAAHPNHLEAERHGTGWRLCGRKPWCSGATGLDRALVTATGVDRRARLFDVEVAALDFDDDWRPVGMRASDSRSARIDLVVAADAEVGAPGCYVDRPGFGHGGVGVAAVWHGIAQHLTHDLAVAAAAAPEQPYLRAAAGRAAAISYVAAAALRMAADEIDAGPDDTDAAHRRAPLVRVGVEHAARSVLDLSVRAQGASALCFDETHARAVVDLTVYLGQVHDGFDAAGISLDGHSC